MPPDREERPPDVRPLAWLESALGLISQHGWNLVIAVLFMAMYFGWLPDPRREAAERLVEGMTSQMAGVRLEMRRITERQVRQFGMLTEICLAFQRHDAKAVGTCSYLYQNHGGDGLP